MIVESANDTFVDPLTDCGSDFTGDPTVVNYKYICDGILVSVVGILGVIGNLICLMVLSKPKLRDCFHQILFALALFDTIYIVIGGINFTFKAFDAGSEAYTISFPYIIYPITHIGLCGTIFMTMAISIERFLGICFPLHLPPNNRKAWFYILPVVLLSIIVNVPKFFEAEIEWVEEGYEWSRAEALNQTSGVDMKGDMMGEVADSMMVEEASPQMEPAYRPTELRKNSNYIKFYIIYFRLFSTAVVPLVVLIVINMKIILELRQVKAKRFGSQRKLWKETNMFLILLCIVVIFMLCHAPRVIIDIWEFSHVDSVVKCNEQLLSGEGKHPFLPPKWILCLTHFSHFSVVFSSSINFLIYCFVGHNFRKEFLQMVGLQRRQYEPSETTVSLRRKSDDKNVSLLQSQ